MQKFIAGLFAFGILLASANAFATDPYICDPDDDPDCECPNDGTYDACYETPVKNLIDPSDPVALRKAANIRTAWNSTTNVYDVYIDATALSAEGVIKLNKNRGRWDSVDEFTQYMRNLFGIRSWKDMCQRMPPVNVRQIGITYRYNQFADRWAKHSSGSLLWDVISDENGAISLAGTEFKLFGADCAGDDPAAFDAQKDDRLYAEQCSDIFSKRKTIVGGGNGDLCSPSDLDYRMNVARTKLETSTFVEFDRTLRCSGGFDGTELVCDESTGVIVHGRVRADKMTLEDTFFKTNNDVLTPTALQLQDAVEAEQSLGDANGVCGEGNTEKSGSLFTTTQTRDGNYDTGEQLCNF